MVQIINHWQNLANSHRIYTAGTGQLIRKYLLLNSWEGTCWYFPQSQHWTSLLRCTLFKIIKQPSKKHIPRYFEVYNIFVDRIISSCSQMHSHMLCSHQEEYHFLFATKWGRNCAGWRRRESYPKWMNLPPDAQTKLHIWRSQGPFVSVWIYTGSIRMCYERSILFLELTKLWGN